MHTCNMTPKIKFIFFASVLMMLACKVDVQGQTYNLQQLAQPDTVGCWILPAQGEAAAPLWGHKDGILLGMAPTPGPRGLIRIFCPYLGLAPDNVMNFIAMEPIPKGAIERGYSELEKSSLDEGRHGKRFWSSDDSLSIIPRDAVYPARGVISKIGDEEVLSFYVFSESFDNGAKVYVKIRLFESRPYEFEMSTFTYDDSVELECFVLTATMGNKARLRTLHLRDKQVLSTELWSDYKGIHFTDRTPIANQDMLRDKDGSIYFIATPNETDYSQAAYHPTTQHHWRYDGKHATQYWIKKNPTTELKGILTGRYTYWMSQAPIPGGVSIENFELNEPFQEGDSYIFGISPEDARGMIQRLNLK